MSKQYCEQFVATATGAAASDHNAMQNSIKTSNSPCEEDNTTQNNQQAEGCGVTATRDAGDIAGSSDSSSPKAKKQLTKQRSLNKVNTPNAGDSFSGCSSSALRDEHGIKKEDTCSPSVSPLAFTNNPTDASYCDTNKTNNLSPLPNEKNYSQFPRSGSCNELDEHSTNVSLTLPGNSINSSNIDTCGLLNPNMSPKSEKGFATNICNMSTKRLNAFNGMPSENQYLLSTTGGGGVGGGNGGGIEYLQQQNHVFVFSTHLANKSAEAVLGGQFPTIIAYHCMQPSTKLFLEDFLKNPARSSKLQRQYSLNIMNVMNSASAGGGKGSVITQPAHWLNDFNNSGNRLAPNKANHMWDPLSESSNPLDLLGGNGHVNDSTKSVAAIAGSIKLEDNINTIPTLQGVKVPDENLTPQQRQHREEQLAKLKKMNKFLFPDKDPADFHSTAAHVLNGGTGTMSGNLGDPIGSFLDGSNKMFQQSVRHIAGNSGSEGGIITPGMLPNSGESTNKPASISKVNTINENAKGRGRGGPCDEQSNILNGTSPEMAPSIAGDNCLTSEPRNTNTENLNFNADEWNKFPNNSFPDDFKNRPINQNSTLPRSLSMGAATGGYSTPPQTSNAPPPSYRQTPRSASVPITTPSPTNIHSSNQDIPLTSPQAPRAPFGTSSPPNSHITNASSGSRTNTTHSITSSLSGNINTSGSVDNTVAPQMSSAGMECIDNTLKLKRSSPQTFKGPAPNELHTDDSCMDGRYHNFPLNYPRGGGVGNTMSAIRLQNMRQMPSQFGRRIDNIPLNPNCSRLTQNKAANNFDPISSLAQMSQQLTGSLGSMGGGGGGSFLDCGNILSGHPGRLNDHSLEHCSLDMRGGGGPLGNRPVQFPGDMNILCGDAMDQRMLNSKMCASNMSGDFNSSPMNAMRDSNIGGNNDIMSPCNRALGRRISSNFDNFNMTSSNIHIRASAPNTIQYMPARCQNISNMRVPPNVDIYQRFPNPQLMGNAGAGHSTGHGGVSASGDMTTNANMMNMFDNCNQMQPSAIGMGGDGGGFEPNHLEGLEGNLLPPNDDYMNLR
ncbi:protein BCL9 homolog [Musca vetustissima]|uniref:protein BCL9 homolog n=1 Tax=Musca vetustissima TaxID=27455 RepID=UPI002AB7793B|nr:protein BCL9 homolog [Musca vetustissima]